ELTEMLGLQGLLTKQVRKLSLGERMKCELAAALLHQPKVLFLDEPTIGLDSNMQLAVRDFIASYNRRHGATVVLTSHYMAAATAGAALAARTHGSAGGGRVFDGGFRSLAGSMAPRRVRRRRRRGPQPEAVLRRYGELRECDELRAGLRVERNAGTETAARLLNDLPVDDIGIEDVPIEEIVGKMFRRTNAAPAPAGRVA